jgi:ribonuclease J
MKSNVAIIKQLKLLKMANLIPIEEMGDYPPDKNVVLATGAQGEEFAVLMRVANKTHKHIALTKNDTIILSSSIIPGNEMSIQKLKDNLYRTEAKIITYLSDKVHSGGHGYRGELEWIHKQVPYKFFMPVHGHHYMLRIHAELSRDLGTPEENIIVPDNGSIVEIQDGGKKLVVLKEKAPSDSSMVDGFTISGTQEVVIRDRKQLAGDGMFVIVVSVDPRTGKIRKSPDIISRGFVYLKGEQKLLNDTRILIKKKVEQSAKNMRPINFDYLKNEITDDVRKYLFKKTAKSPMVIPVVIGV